MKYEIYIEEPKKMQPFYKKAIAEYEKRLGRYCKISCHIVKKEKDWAKYLNNQMGTQSFLVIPGEARMTSEILSEQIGEWEKTGEKKILFFIPALQEGQNRQTGTPVASSNCAGVHTPEDYLTVEDVSIKKIRDRYDLMPLILSDFVMSPSMTGMILYEQIYRGYRILHHHPYHK